MFGFEHNDVDPHNTVASRTLKVMLRLHLPALRREIQNSIAEGFQAYFGKLSTVTSGKVENLRYELWLIMLQTGTEFLRFG